MAAREYKPLNSPSSAQARGEPQLSPRTLARQRIEQTVTRCLDRGGLSSADVAEVLLELAAEHAPPATPAPAPSAESLPGGALEVKE